MLTAATWDCSKSRAQPAAHTWGSAGSHRALPRWLHQSWWVQSLDRLWLSPHQLLLLPGQAGRASVPFLHTLLHDLMCQSLFPCPGCWCCPGTSYGAGGMDIWPPLLLKHPSPVSHCCASCRFLAARSASPGDPLFRKLEQLTSPAI